MIRFVFEESKKLDFINAFEQFVKRCGWISKALIQVPVQCFNICLFNDKMIITSHAIECWLLEEE